MNRFRIISVACAAIASFALAACGGGGGGASRAVPQPVASIGSSATTSVPASGAFVIHIPAVNATASAAVRRAQYISASTESVSIGITPAPGCTNCSQTQIVTANLGPGAPNCSGASGSTTCTVGFNALPGNYTFNVNTYSGPLSGATPTGNALSTDTGFPATIVNGQANAVGITLNGIPASLSLTISTPEPSEGFIGDTLYVGIVNGAFASRVDALDASGNLITGMGTVTLSTVETHGTPSAAITAVPIPNSQYLDVGPGSPANLNVDSVALTLHGTACSLPGAVCTRTIQLRYSQVLAIVDGSSVDVYTTFGSFVGSPTSGVSQPTGAVFDAAGRLLVSNFGNNTITDYIEPFSRAPFGTVNGVNGPLNLIATIDGEVLAASQTDIYEAVAPYNSILNDLSGFTFAFKTASDTSDGLYVLDSGTHNLLKYNLPYAPQITNLAYTTPTTLAGPIAVSSNNALFLADRTSSSVREFDASGTLTGLSLATHGGTANNMALDANDDIAVFDQSVNGIDFYKAPGYANTLIPMPPGAGTPRNGVFDTFGNLWVSDPTKVYELLAPSWTLGMTLPAAQAGSISIYPRR